MKTLILATLLFQCPTGSPDASVQSISMASSKRVVVRYTNGMLSVRDQDNVRDYYREYDLVFKAVAWEEDKIVVSEAPPGADPNDIAWYIRELVSFETCND